MKGLPGGQQLAHQMEAGLSDPFVFGFVHRPLGTLVGRVTRPSGSR